MISFEAFIASKINLICLVCVFVVICLNWFGNTSQLTFYEVEGRKLTVLKMRQKQIYNLLPSLTNNQTSRPICDVVKKLEKSTNNVYIYITFDYLSKFLYSFPKTFTVNYNSSWLSNPPVFQKTSQHSVDNLEQSEYCPTITRSVTDLWHAQYLRSIYSKY